MTAAVPTSSLTPDQLLKLANFRRDLADDLDAALTAAVGAGLSVIPYVATGAEAPGGFTVTIPSGPLAAANYNVTFWGVEADIIVPWGWSFFSKTVDDFVVKFAGDGLTAGGTYYFVIAE